MKSPAFQFYSGDWLRCAELRMCSSGARGLWIDMIAFMHQAEPYGHLVFAGKPVGPGQLAKMVGEAPKDVAKWLKELAEAGVYSVNDSGVIYSRRMTRDEAKRVNWKRDQDAHRARKAARSHDTPPDTPPDNAPPSGHVSGQCQGDLPIFPSSISTNTTSEKGHTVPVDNPQPRRIDSTSTPRAAAHSLANAERVKAENAIARANAVPSIPEALRKFVPRRPDPDAADPVEATA